MLKRIVLLITLVFAFNTAYAQKALKILKDDGSITYINASAVNKITFETPLAIGDTYQGGIIFYLDDSGEHGLIAAPSNQSDALQLSPPIDSEHHADGVGAGEENTYKIVGGNEYGESESYAAKLCSDLTLGGFTDWYVPSKYELNLMYTYLHQQGLGSFVGGTGFYWSSTADGFFSSTEAWFQDFASGGQMSWSRGSPICVRAVRAF